MLATTAVQWIAPLLAAGVSLLSPELNFKDTEVALYPIEREIVVGTNAERARYGLAPLQVDRSLIQTARAHTVWMARYRTLQHTQIGVAENIAMGQSTAAEAVQSWMQSPGHRANLLNSSYSRIGVAAYAGPDGTIYWCQQFLP